MGEEPSEGCGESLNLPRQRKGRTRLFAGCGSPRFLVRKPMPSHSGRYLKDNQLFEVVQTELPPPPGNMPPPLLPSNGKEALFGFGDALRRAMQLLPSCDGADSLSKVIGGSTPVVSEKTTVIPCRSQLSQKVSQLLCSRMMVIELKPAAEVCGVSRSLVNVLTCQLSQVFSPF